ncbi:hypothetical protein ACHAXT_000337 [Thalassiosira profunda]
MSIPAGNSKEAAVSPLRPIRHKAAARGGRSTPQRQRSFSAPAVSPLVSPSRASLLVEEHYRLDPDDRALLPGLPVNDDDDARELHDFFNLIALVPVVVLNGLNWDFDELLDWDSNKSLQQCWTGEWFPLFFAVTVGYFLADLLWVCIVPHCVKSPGVIVQHHIATLLYLIIPYRFEEEGWLMGACLSVEVNTWLLIARRVFNKQGFGPWVWEFGSFSLRIKLISVLFYITWVAIRCFFYPTILQLLWTLWLEQWRRTGVVFYTRYSVALVLHSVFNTLNAKWTFDLFRGKWRALRNRQVAKVEKGL